MSQDFVSFLMALLLLIIGLLWPNGGGPVIPPLPQPQPTATATVGPTPSASPTESPTPTPTVSESPSASPTLSPTPTPTVTEPPAPMAAWPAAHNTGYPKGLPGDTRAPVTLTPYSGPYTITTPNTTIAGKDIRSTIYVRAPGVVIMNSRFLMNNAQAININNVYHATIVDTEIDGQGLDNSAGGISLVGDGSYTMIRVNAHRSGDIARINWGGVAVIDSWLHNPLCIQSSCHNDILQSTNGNCRLGIDSINGRVPGTTDNNDGNYCIKLVHNRLENQHTQTSCILLKADQNNIHDVLVKDNLFNGGGYTVYWYDSNDLSTYHSTNGHFINNRFMRTPSGYWPKGGYWGTHAIRAGQLPEWSGNVWDDNGAPINR